MRFTPLVLVALLAAALVPPAPAAPGLTIYLQAAGHFALGLPAAVDGVTSARFAVSVNACHRALYADVEFAPEGASIVVGDMGARVGYELIATARDASGATVGSFRIQDSAFSRPLGTANASGPHEIELALTRGADVAWTLRVRGLAAAGEPECLDRLLVAEVEANPPGVDTGAEWVELLNPGIFPVNASGWVIHALHGTPARLTLPEGTWVAPGERFVVGFSTQFLDNSDEEVILLDSFGGAIDRAPPLSDGTNDDRAWQRSVDGEWFFAPATRGLPPK